MIRTQRLTLRNWKSEDAPALYSLAKDSEVASRGGWPAHTSVEMSRQVIETVFNDAEIYAIVLHDTEEVIGCIGAPLNDDSPIGVNERILGYWVGKDYFNKGYVTEATKVLIDHLFNHLRCPRVWCTNFPDNIPSAKVQEKCGFEFHRIDEGYNWGMPSQSGKVEVRCLENRKI